MKCQSCSAVLSKSTCDYCSTICADFLDKELAQQKLKEKQKATANSEESPLVEKLEDLQNTYTGTGASIESEREQMLYDFLRGIGLIKFFVGDWKVLPPEMRNQVLRDFSIPETEKPIAYADTSLSAISKNALKTGLLFCSNGIYIHNKKSTSGMTYEEYKRANITVKSGFFDDAIYIGTVKFALRGQIHSNIAKSLQALQEIL